MSKTLDQIVDEVITSNKFKDGNLLPPLDPEVKIPGDKVTVINIDELKPNSVIVINVDVNGPLQKMAVAPAFSKLLSPYINILKEKRITVMLLTTKETMEIITEEEMNASGWERKEKSLIINPFGK